MIYREGTKETKCRDVKIATFVIFAPSWSEIPWVTRYNGQKNYY